MNFLKSRLRIRKLDRYFIIIGLVIVTAGMIVTALTMTQIKVFVTQYSVRQVIQTARLLTQTVERDITVGDYRNAWKQLNRSTSSDGFIGFLIVDSEGRLLVEDIDSSQKLKAIHNSHRWTPHTIDTGLTANISTSHEFISFDSKISKESPEAATAHIQFVFKISELIKKTDLIQILFFIFSFGYILFSLFAIAILRKKFIQSLGHLSVGITQTLYGKEPTVNASELMSDYFPTSQAIKTFKSDFETMRLKLQEQTKLAITGQITAQVAHDIRSPLSSLLLVSENSPHLDEKARILLRDAVNKIRDIANNLLSENKTKHSTIAHPSDGSCDSISSEVDIRAEHLSSLIESAVSQKRAQLSQRETISISFEPSASTYGLFSKIQPTDFSRLLSNLINNSIEAVGPNGKVSLSLEDNRTLVSIHIKDNGKGIPTEILKKLGERGVTHGKEGTTSGTALGVYHAKKTIESWGGKFHVSSELGAGSQVTLTLRKEAPPAWFVDSIQLKTPSTIIILDDDEGIHEIWKNRFANYLSIVSLIHFHSPEEVIAWFRNQVGIVENPIYLFDFELIGSKQTGLDTIETLSIAQNSILITSRWEEERIRSRCEKFDIPLIPKTMTPFVPIFLVK